ncbi:LON peptidase substrate-binding domain-containing protein [Luminiphilus syltensis]|nr:LON peptidase substrate-binding domain-containing protein [Luminiphilus syltensis]
MTEIPLFPLSTVLLPHGHMPLQIFEQRYIDLIARTMREQSGFGVVWMRRGAEIAGEGISTPDLGDYGTFARIVDWDQLDNGLLGITIRGNERFDVGEVWREPDGLVMASVELAEPLTPTPLLERWESLTAVLKGLEMHPHVQRMNLSIDYDDAWEVAYTLLQLLPFDESIKYELLGMTSIETLVAELDLLLNQVSGEDAE